MKLLRFDYDVFTIIQLSKEEVEKFSHLCERHYDHAVRSLSNAGQDAILNEARNKLIHGDTDNVCEIRVSYRQLDTLCKATESEGGAFGPYVDLWRMLRVARIESARVNGIMNR